MDAREKNARLVFSQLENYRGCRTARNSLEVCLKRSLVGGAGGGGIMQANVSFNVCSVFTAGQIHPLPSTVLARR